MAMAIINTKNVTLPIFFAQAEKASRGDSSSSSASSESSESSDDEETQAQKDAKQVRLLF